MDSSVITVQEAQTERDCRLQLIHAVNYVFHRKNCHENKHCCCGSSFRPGQPEALGWVRGSVQFPPNQVGLYILFMCKNIHIYVCVYI